MSSLRGNEVTLLNNQQALTDGVWVDIRELNRKAIHILGTFSATIQIRGSCEPTIPANTAHGAQIGSNITTAQLVEISAPVKWIKCSVTTYTSGAIFAHLFGRSIN